MFVLCSFCSGEEAFYPTANTLGVGEHKDSEEGINHMVEDLEKQYVYTLLHILIPFSICDSVFISILCSCMAYRKVNQFE